MSRLPTVAIIGRPNTGKSTLFNRLTRSRKALVSDIPGTTRDHVAHKVDDERLPYLLIDTGGVGGGSEDHDLEDDVSAQSLLALASADLILFTVNAREELTASDMAVVEMLRKRRKRHVPVILAATKCDRPELIEQRTGQYYELAIGDTVVGVSAVHGMGMDELEAAIVRHLRELHFTKEETTGKDNDRQRIAVIGKPNVGKSSLINALMSDPQRASSPRLVSDIPGTTRDASDTVIRHEDKEYIFVDTAGLRRQAKVEEELESLSHIKSIQALQNSDIAILVVSANEPVSKQDKRIAALAEEEGKGLIILINKADLLTSAQKKEKADDVRVALQFCSFAPVLFTSALNREGVLKIFPLIATVVANRNRRISIKDLRMWYEQAAQRLPDRTLGRSKYVTQAADPPPTFVLFVSHPRGVLVSHLRYLENSLRSTFAFEGTPIRWITKDRRQADDD